MRPARTGSGRGRRATRARPTSSGGESAGLTFVASSLTTAAVTALADSERSLAGAIIFTLRIGGGALGLGLMTAIVASSSAFLDGFRTGFRVNAVFAALALVVTLLAVRLR